MTEGADEKGEVEELRELFSVLGREVPNLVRGLIDPLKELLNIIYDPEKTRERAKAIASFYRELKDQGIPDSMIIELMREHFVNPLSLLKSVLAERGKEEEEDE